MEHYYTDGFKDFLTQKNFSMESTDNLKPHRYRAKMKAGFSTLTVSALSSLVWGVDRGLGDGVSRDVTNGLQCGEYVTIYIYPDDYRFRFARSITGSNMGTFLSQFEKVYDFFPDYIKCDDNIEIKSENFTEESGLFDSCESAVTFDNSTFKIGPKVYSDAAMLEFQSFPRTQWGNDWIPFEGCPNLESIKNQGTFGPFLEILNPCYLSFTRPDGTDDISAYPQGGAPRSITRYVNAKKLRFSEKFPEFNTSRLKVSIEPWVIDEIIIDAAGAPSLPFGGIDYTGVDMEELSLYDAKFTIDLPMQPQAQNFVFSWGTLGVTAPASCGRVKNLHQIFQFSTDENVLTPIADVEVLKTQIHFSWGQKLEAFLEENPELTNDLMPLVPTGMERLEGYYHKKVAGENLNVSPTFGGYRSKIVFNEIPHTYQPQPLPEGINSLLGYCIGLYSHQEIDSDITIPKIPESVTYLRDAYRRTFYCAVGPGVPVAGIPEISPPTIATVWAKSDQSSHNNVVFEVNTVESATSQLAEIWGPTNDVLPINTLIYRMNSSGSAVGTESWNSWEEMRAALSVPGSIYAEDRTIKTTVTLNRGTLDNLVYCGDFMREAYFGSGIVPTVVDTLIPVEISKEWDTYARALIVENVITFANMPQFWYKGFIEYPATSFPFNRSYRVDFATMFSNVAIDTSFLDPYVYELDDIIMSGSGRTPISDEVIRPYNYTFTGNVTGDMDTFLSSNSINVDKLAAFVSKDILVGQFGASRGNSMGWNAFQFTNSDATSGQQRYWSFVASYNRGVRFGNPLIPDPNPEPGVIPLYFNPPIWSDSARITELAPGSFYLLNNRSDGTTVMQQINN